MNSVQCLWLCGAGILVCGLIFYRAAGAGQRVLNEIIRWELEEMERKNGKK